MTCAARTIFVRAVPSVILRPLCEILAMNDLLPIDIRDEQLARSGEFKNVVQMEPTLMEEHGVTKAKNYTNNRTTQSRVNEICREASSTAK